MGWCSATAIFDQVAAFVLEVEASDERKRHVLSHLAGALEAEDWDCQRDSQYYDHPIVQAVMRDHHPSWFEGETMTETKLKLPTVRDLEAMNILRSPQVAAEFNRIVREILDARKFPATTSAIDFVNGEAQRVKDQLCHRDWIVKISASPMPTGLPIEVEIDTRKTRLAATQNTPAAAVAIAALIAHEFIEW